MSKSTDNYSTSLDGLDQDMFIDRITILITPSPGSMVIVKDLYMKECTFPLGKSVEMTGFDVVVLESVCN